MKFTASAALLAILELASARKPQFSITIRDGNFDGIDGLDPTVVWSDTTKSGDIDITYGIKASLRPTSDISSLPKKIWGKASTSMSGWDVSAKAELDGQDFSTAELEADAFSSENDLSLHAEGRIGPDLVVNSVKATKAFMQDGARVTVTPRYDLNTEEKDVIVTYSKDKTDAKLIANSEEQELTISQQMDDKNRIAPTVNNLGDFSCEWERTLSDTSSVTASVKPNDFLDVMWKDNDWTATFNMPIDGANIKSARVSIKRDVEF